VLVREANRLFKPLGISAVQFNVLNLLKDAPAGLRPTQLTRALVVDASSTTYVLDRMEALGWIGRAEDKADRRANVIRLTPAGQRMHATVAPLYLAALGEMLRRLDPAPLPLLAQALDAIRGAAQSAVDRTQADPPAARKSGRRRADAGPRL